LKIVRLVNSLDFGGLEKRMLNISHYRGSDLHFIFVAINSGGHTLQLIRKNNKDVFVLGLSIKIPSFYTIYKLWKFFKSVKPDVVHCSGAEANFHGIIAAYLANITIIIGEEIGIPSQKRLANFIFSLVYKLCDKVVGNSIPVINYLKDKNRVPEIKVSLLHNPFIFEEMPEKIINKESKFIITLICRLEPIKNISGFLKAFSSLEKKFKNKCEIWLIGDGSLKNELQLLAKELHISGNIILLGFQGNPYHFLRQSNLFVLFSSSEGFSNSLVEAMYAQVPVLSSAVGVAPDIIIDGFSGFLVPANDIVELSVKLRIILNMNSKNLLEIGLRGSDYVKNNFSIEKHISDLKNIYFGQKD